MEDQIKAEFFHRHEDPAESLDRLDHFLSDLQALIDRYQDRNVIPLERCQLISMERAGKIREKF